MNYFNQLKDNKDQIKEAIITLNQKGVVNLSNFFENEFRKQLINETLSVFEKKMQRKHFLMKQTENTPRRMYAVPESDIDELSKLIPEFYCNSEIKEFLSIISREDVEGLPWKGERYVINGLSQSNDTHGWHWDDYSYALVFIAKSPVIAQGGALECIPNTVWNRKRPQISSIVKRSRLDRYHYEDGSFYLMRSDTTLHRVAPIVSGALRVAIAMSWCTEADQKKDIDHATVYELYGV